MALRLSCGVVVHQRHLSHSGKRTQDRPFRSGVVIADPSYERRSGGLLPNPRGSEWGDVRRNWDGRKWQREGQSVDGLGRLFPSANLRTECRSSDVDAGGCGSNAGSTCPRSRKPHRENTLQIPSANSWTECRSPVCVMSDSLGTTARPNSRQSCWGRRACYTSAPVCQRYER